MEDSLHFSTTCYLSFPLSEQLLTLIIAASQYENVTGRTFATNLVFLQVMLLMAIEADNRDPARGQVGFPQSYWLGSAVGLAYSMKLHAQKILGQQSDNDPDSEDKLSRRIWWSAVIMDRWHAASTSSPLMVPDTSLVIFPEDRVLVGENLYQLARKFNNTKLRVFLSDIFRSIRCFRTLCAHTHHRTPCPWRSP